MSQIRRLEFFISVEIGQGAHQSSSRSLCDPPQILLLAAPDSHGASLNEELKDHVVNALRSKNHIGARLKDHLDAFKNDSRLSLTDLLQLVGVVDGDLHTELHSLLLQVHIQASDLRISYPSRHGLRSNGTVDGIPVDKQRLCPTFSVSLEKVDSLNRIFDLILLIRTFHQKHRIDRQICKEIRVRANDLARHGGLRNVDQAILPQDIDFCGNILVHILDSFSESQSVSVDDGGRVYPILHQLVCSS